METNFTFLAGEFTQAIKDGTHAKFVEGHKVELHGINVDQLIAALKLFCAADTVFVTVVCPIINSL